jgi:pimeloyl-ACP methyl ester carboxylesterase
MGSRIFQYFELVLCGLCLICATSFHLRVIPDALHIPLLILTIVLMLGHIFITTWRWQMLPCWLVLSGTLILFISGSEPDSGSFVALVFASTLLVGVSALLVAGMPLRKLPRPDGPYAVGAIGHALTDSSRPASLTSDIPGRELRIKAWYPASESVGAGQGKRERLWRALYGNANTPALMRILTRYFGWFNTHTHEDAALNQAVSDLPILIYNHGLISFVSENTLLMEHLASHGFIVIGIQHSQQFRELQDLNQATPKDKRERDAGLLNRLKEDLTAQERAEISLQIFRTGINTNRIVAARSADTAHVLDRLTEIVRQIPQSGDVSINTQCAGLFGLSLGGAIATELSKTDPRVLAVVNLDGGIFGVHIEEPVSVPYLMMSSAGNEGGNDLALKDSDEFIRKVTLPETAHTDCHDASLFVPMLRWLGVSKHPNPVENINLRNRHVSRFFEEQFG